MHCLVTGGAGFIGSNLVDELLAQGHSVRALDNFSTGFTENLTNAFTHQSTFELIQGDVTDVSTCINAAKNCDVIFHHAAKISVPESIENPTIYHHANVTGTHNILHAAVTQKVKRVINAGSSAAYGMSTNLPLTENEPTSFLSPYATTKFMQEVYTRAFHETYGLETINLRYFNAYGPRQDPASAYAAVIPIFIRKILRCQTPIVYGDGKQTRDFVFVKDIVAANLAAAQANIANGQTYNVASGKAITINALAKKVFVMLNFNHNITHQQARKGDILHSYASIKKIENDLQWSPIHDLDQGITQTITWYQKQEEGL